MGLHYAESQDDCDFAITQSPLRTLSMVTFAPMAVKIVPDLLRKYGLFD